MSHNDLSFNQHSMTSHRRTQLRSVQLITATSDLEQCQTYLLVQYIYIHSVTRHEGPEGEQRCSSTLSLNSTLDGNGWSTPRPDCFSPGESLRHPLNIWVPKLVCTMLPLFYCKAGGKKFELTQLRNTSTAAC